MIAMEDCTRCGNAAGRSAVLFGKRLFCSADCLGVWTAGRDIESLSKIDALDGRLATCREAMMRASTALHSMKLSVTGQETVAKWLDEAIGKVRP